MRKTILFFEAAVGCAILLAACSTEQRTYSSTGGAGGHGGAGGEAAQGGAGPGSGGSGGGGGGVDPAIEEACSKYAQNVCDRYSQCAPGVITRFYSDDATCRDRYILYCKALLTAPGTGWTPALAVECSNQYLGLDCNLYTAQPFRAVDETTPPACVPPLGALPDGAPCLDTGQCASGNCRHAIGAFCGICGPRAAGGEACSTNLDCVGHNVCVNGQCISAGELGTMCDPTAIPCNLPWDCFGGACTTPGFDMETCNGNGPACAFFSGYYCNTMTSKCEAFQYSPPGTACGVMNNMLYDCASAGNCVNNVCIAHAADGEACDAMQGAICTPPAFCVNGTCQLPEAAACK